MILARCAKSFAGQPRAAAEIEQTGEDRVPAPPARRRHAGFAGRDRTGPRSGGGRRSPNIDRRGSGHRRAAPKTGFRRKGGRGAKPRRRRPPGRARSASRKAAAASARRPSPFQRLAEAEPAGRPMRREIDGLAEQIARRLEIARVKRAPRPLIASVGGEVAGRAGRRHAFQTVGWIEARNGPQFVQITFSLFWLICINPVWRDGATFS